MEGIDEQEHDATVHQSQSLRCLNNFLQSLHPFSQNPRSRINPRPQNPHHHKLVFHCGLQPQPQLPQLGAQHRLPRLRRPLDLQALLGHLQSLQRRRLLPLRPNLSNLNSQADHPLERPLSNLCLPRPPGQKHLHGRPSLPLRDLQVSMRQRLHLLPEHGVPHHPVLHHLRK